MSGNNNTASLVAKANRPTSWESLQIFCLRFYMFYKLNNIWINVSGLRLKKKLLSLVIELTLILSPLYICWDTNVLFLSLLQKLRSRSLIQTSQSLNCYSNRWWYKLKFVREKISLLFATPKQQILTCKILQPVKF